MLMYTDDTALIVTDKSTSEIEEEINAELAKLADWFAANKFTTKGTKYFDMLFHS